VNPRASDSNRARQHTFASFAAYRFGHACRHAISPHEQQRWLKAINS
jgi:hypothetical protein